MDGNSILDNTPNRILSEKNSRLIELKHQRLCIIAITAF